MPYGAGAEYGQRGKWAGFERYGRRGERFATRALETQADEVQRIITEELQELITMNGWPR